MTKQDYQEGGWCKKSARKDGSKIIEVSTSLRDGKRTVRREVADFGIS